MKSDSLKCLSVHSSGWPIAVLGLLLSATLPLRAEITLESLLDEMTDFGAVARWPQPEYTCREASSYDRATKSPDQPGWFANTDQNQFIRTETHQGRTEKVMLDTEGPGSIVRFWLTTDQKKQGTLRFYLDGAAEPSLVFPAYDLLSGDLGIGAPLAQPHPGYRPDSNGGNNFHLPVPYAKHCKITWEEAGNSSRYYQINYRTYPPGTAVRSFTRAALDAARSAVGRANKKLETPPDDPSGQRIAMKMDLAAGATRAMDLPSGPAAVRRLELKLPLLTEQALRSLIVQMDCDGERTIWCPAGDFFGSGVGMNSLRSWYRTVTEDGTMICRWVMPYRKDAAISLTNLAGAPVKVDLTAITGPWQWDDRSMHFHTVWHHEAGLGTTPHRDWNFVKIAGRGVYVGDTLALFNPVATWYGEGDEKIRVDGEKFPSHLGTGTEDYYGYSYAPKPVHQTPFCGQPRIDQPATQGHNTSTRTRNLDGIPFRKSLQFDIELISWKPTTLTYAATTHWYAFPGASTNLTPQPAAAVAPVPTLAEAIAAAANASLRPGAIECETLKILTKSGDFFVGGQDMEPFGGERWSSGHQLLGKTTAIGDAIEIEIPCPDAAPRKLVLHATQAPDFAMLRFQVNGKATAIMLDGHADSVQPAPALVLGVFEPRDGKFTLRVEVAGANPASTGAKYFFGLDCVLLEKP
ncbi:MAG: glycoside hydrolase family 172 protein [Verrucomicrobiota bacterium]